MHTWIKTIPFASLALITSACTDSPKQSVGEAGSGISSLDDGDEPDTEGPGDGDGDDDPTTAGGGDGDGDPTTTAGDGDGDPDDGNDDSQTKFDLAGIPDTSGNGCAAPYHNPCDDEDSDPWHALGINCQGEWELTTQFTGDAQALYVLTGQLGTYMPPTYPTLEGEKMVILSSGIAQQLTIPGQFASTQLPGNDPGQLPAPLTAMPVDPSLQTDCNDDPDLIGNGDCSNTIKDQWSQGNGAYDYAELRITGEVPNGASGFSYNLAFFSTEYPGFYHTTYNDMYIAWLESEKWTGNVSFDEMGHPISLNAGFLDYKDAPNQYDCPNVCQAPELQGTAMQMHAGTKWLTTSAGVEGGEDFTLIFAIFDLSDNVLDSMVILDNFAWNCEGGPPITVPG